jgi:predicted acyltransferase
MKSLLNQFTLKSHSTSGRILSVDALRGFDMFWIIGGEMVFKSLDKVFQNTTTAWINIQLDHVEWLGFRFYDIIMPLFIFIVGVAMPFSFSKRLAAGDSKMKIMTHVVKRVVILWILGMMVQGHLLSYSLEKLHLYSNTLQAIAAGYFISSILILYTKAIGQIIGTFALMLVYWLVMVFLPTGEGSGAYLPENNAAIYLDKLLMGSFQDGSTYSWVLSSLNFGATTMLGVFSGYLLRSDFTKYRKVAYLLIFAAVCYLLAIVWHPAHPIIKHIWTGSFVLYAGSFSILLVAVFYLVIDVWNFKAWSNFFIIIGANAIVAYVASHLFDFKYISDIFISGLEQYVGNWYYFLRYTGGFLVLFGLLWFMYVKKIFVRV